MLVRSAGRRLIEKEGVALVLAKWLEWRYWRRGIEIG
jgi:hypothetical protein